MKARRRTEEQVLRDLVTALALCNNVTPVYENRAEGVKSPKEGQNSSIVNAYAIREAIEADTKEPQL